MTAARTAEILSQLSADAPRRASCADGMVAATDGAAAIVEELQFTLGEGPCVDSRTPFPTPVAAAAPPSSQTPPVLVDGSGLSTASSSVDGASTAARRRSRGSTPPVAGSSAERHCSPAGTSSSRNDTPRTAASTVRAPRPGPARGATRRRVRETTRDPHARLLPYDGGVRSRGQDATDGRVLRRLHHEPRTGCRRADQDEGRDQQRQPRPVCGVTLRRAAQQGRSRLPAPVCPGRAGRWRQCRDVRSAVRCLRLDSNQQPTDQKSVVRRRVRSRQGLLPKQVTPLGLALRVAPAATRAFEHRREGVGNRAGQLVTGARRRAGVVIVGLGAA